MEYDLTDAVLKGSVLRITGYATSQGLKDLIIFLGNPDQVITKGGRMMGDVEFDITVTTNAKTLFDNINFEYWRFDEDIDISNPGKWEKAFK